jgi:hypothetical protein
MIINILGNNLNIEPEQLLWRLGQISARDNRQLLIRCHIRLAPL